MTAEFRSFNILATKGMGRWEGGAGGFACDLSARQIVAIRSTDSARSAA